MKIVSKQNGQGKTIYNSDIVCQIVKCAFEEIQGAELASPKNSAVSSRYGKGIKMETVGDVLHIDVFVKQCHFVNVRDTAFKIQQNIKNSLETMTDFKVGDINIHVIDVDFDNGEQQ